MKKWEQDHPIPVSESLGGNQFPRNSGGTPVFMDY